MIISLEETIEAPIENVWQALTDSHLVAQYMFGSQIESEWQIDEPITFYIQNEGERQDMVFGYIKELSKHTLFKHTLYPLEADYPNTAENHIYVEYRLFQKGEHTLLLIEQGGFEDAAEGEKRFNSASEGWKLVLPKLKSVAESMIND